MGHGGVIGPDWTYIGLRRWWIIGKRLDAKGQRVARNTLQGVVWLWTPLDGKTAPWLRVEIMRPLAVKLPLIGRSMDAAEIITRHLFNEDAKRRGLPQSDPRALSLLKKATQVLFMDEAMASGDVRAFAAKFMDRAQTAGLEAGTWPLTYLLAAAKYVEAAREIDQQAMKGAIER